MSFEVKRGKGSGLWHPHVHMVWLCEQKPDARQLSKNGWKLQGIVISWTLGSYTAIV